MVVGRLVSIISCRLREKRGERSENLASNLTLCHCCLFFFFYFFIFLQNFSLTTESCDFSIKVKGLFVTRLAFPFTTLQATVVNSHVLLFSRDVLQNFQQHPGSGKTASPAITKKRTRRKQNKATTTQHQKRTRSARCGRKKVFR